MQYAKGRYRDYPHIIKHLRGRILEIESSETLRINIDGESSSGNRVVFELVSGALNYIFPAGMLQTDEQTQYAKA